MKKIFFTVAATALLVNGHAATKTKVKKKKTADIQVVGLTTERMTAPMSIDTPTPRLGWRITATKNDVAQKSYRIIVSSTKEKAQNLRATCGTRQWFPTSRNGLNTPAKRCAATRHATGG